VAFPLFLQPRYNEYKNAALVHTVGGDTLEKIRFTFGLYMSTFMCDPSALFFNFIEMCRRWTVRNVIEKLEQISLNRIELDGVQFDQITEIGAEQRQIIDLLKIAM